MDVDLQALAVSDQGMIMGAVFGENKYALGEGMRHSGDNLLGDAAGYNEVVRVHFQHLPPTAKCIFFVVACGNGRLCDVPDGHIHLLEGTKENCRLKIPFEKSDQQVDVVGLFLRGPRSWLFRQIEVKAAAGQHFIDILEPTIGNLIRKEIPRAPQQIQPNFALDQGSVVDFPQMQRATIGLGWKPAESASPKLDLDASAVLLQAPVGEGGHVDFGKSSVQDTVWYKNVGKGATRGGIEHSGDNRTGDKDGDDETMVVNFGDVDPSVMQIAIVVNMYTEGIDFSQVSSCYARVLGENGDELACYDLTHDGAGHTALILGRLLRAPGSRRWRFQAIGVPCDGRNVTNLTPAVLAACQKTPLSLQVGSAPAPSATPSVQPAGEGFFARCCRCCSRRRPIAGAGSADRLLPR